MNEFPSELKDDVQVLMEESSLSNRIHRTTGCPSNLMHGIDLSETREGRNSGETAISSIYERIMPRQSEFEILLSLFKQSHNSDML